MTALFDRDGVVTRWPRKARERDEVLDHLASKFEPGRIYKETDVTGILSGWHGFGDHALLRRELFESGRLGHDPRSGTYWLIEKG
ncbi:DUF2087 domain-containing protein [Mesorhizobium sp. CN2-181]|uniref:DUF2087 domain-containing protein n=1 Tax=Mesorhizobium yinganensis TaxID=3157707 RepID=UPI0032B6F97C